MGWKYEIALYEPMTWNYDYVVIYEGNSYWKVQWLMWVHRNHPCVRLVIR